jgi:isoleucyl-tRNA synthetase
MDELDRWALNRLQEMNERVQRAYKDFEFHLVYHTLHNFCVIDLSSFYLDIIKDRLYVSPKDSQYRRSAQTAMNEILQVLIRLMAPILSFTADEIWQYIPNGDQSPSVHADLFVPIKNEFKDIELAERWEEIIKIRKEVTKTLELARKDKVIGHSLDSSVILALPDKLYDLLVPYKDTLRSIFIVSSVDLAQVNEVEEGYESEEISGLKIKVAPSEDKKCERCWVHDPSVGKNGKHSGICIRCIDALTEMEMI